MKKITLFFIALFSIVILTPTNGFGQGTVQIGSGTGTVSGGAGIPVSNYVFNYNQQLVTADEYSAGGGVAGDITKIRYYPTNVGTITVWNTWTVYIGNTTKTNFSSTTDWIPLTELTEVFNGTITPDPVSNEWFEITFTTPFDYTGGNIVVAVHEYAPGWNVAPTFRAYTSTANAGIYYRSDSTNPNPSAPPTATGRVANLPQLQFEGTLASCLPPTNLTSTNLTSTSADLTWTPGSGETTWNLEWKAGENFTPGNAEEDAADIVTGTPAFSASGLSSNTSYYVYLQSDCGAGDVSGWAGPLVFTTLCAVFTPDYTEDFTTFLPSCWEEADSGDPLTGPTDIGSGAWTADGWLNSGSTGAAKINIYWNTKSDWLITPAFDLSGGGYEVNFDVAFTVWNGTGPGTFDPDDEVQLLYTEDGTTWVNLETWNASNVPSNTGDNRTFDISTLTGTNVQFAFWAKEDPAGLTSTDNDFFIDNFKVRTPPSCSEPTNLNNVVLTLDSTELSWTPGDAETLWDIELIDITGGGSATGTPTVTGVTNPYLASGLTEGNDYSFYVRADCAANGVSAWVGPFAWSQPVTGGVCEFSIPVTSLPFTTTDNTANYNDNYSGSPGATGCTTTSNYLNGDDVVYAYTATSDTSINISMDPVGTWSGIFIYTNCDDIGVACVAGVANSGSAERLFEDFSVVSGTTYYIVISTWPTPQSTAYTLTITENTCTAATVSYNVVNDCDNSGGFLVDVEITDMGTATDITVTDDQGSTPLAVTSVGTYQFGPYTNGTGVIFTVSDDSDANCLQTSSAITQVACPPSNDNCIDAIVVTAPSTTPFSNIASTNDAPAGSCGTTPGATNVWFKFTATGEGSLVVGTCNDADFDTKINVYSGECGTLVCEGGNDDAAGCSLTSQLTLNNLPAGDYYIAVSGFSGATGTGNVTLDFTLSNSDFDNPSAFNFYPNPVKNTLTLNAQNNIEQVTVFNMLGQAVLKLSPHTTSSEVDMTTLVSGTYFAQVTVNGIVKTVKVVKQ